MSEDLRLTDESIEQTIAGSVVYPPGGTYGPLRYREIQLVLLHSGSMEVEVDGAAYKVHPGQLLLLLPEENVYIAFDRSGKSRHRWITLSLREYEADLQHQLHAMPRTIPISEPMNRLVDLSVMQRQTDLPEYRSVANALGLAAIRLYAAESARNDALIANPVIGKVKSFIHEHYAIPLSMKEIADHANVSASHLVRLFKQAEQTTPIQYLWDYRVEHSLVLLRTTGLSVGEIAEQCGFKSRYHYSRSVKRYTGKSASEIRALHWQSR
ncbi:helix-turn-helix transcriptional regulator [Cohnella phaseoli]|uniref:AraC family transcriptional regulator of arabinose operon n=1 Tax=Cohnella phaseoli TaxID=456490 RepID=A0A3D9IRK3_9BACL|nr:AraC family transcriptional regulator [Cohnella phaseoli]RED64410.1 AraC family transcriptional regulator of arabinose operon [Cohnella phaseoli]